MAVTLQGAAEPVVIVEDQLAGNGCVFDVVTQTDVEPAAVVYTVTALQPVEVGGCLGDIAVVGLVTGKFLQLHVTASGTDTELVGCMGCGLYCTCVAVGKIGTLTVTSGSAGGVNLLLAGTEDGGYGELVISQILNPGYSTLVIVQLIADLTAGQVVLINNGNHGCVTPCGGGVVVVVGTTGTPVITVTITAVVLGKVNVGQLAGITADSTAV